MGCFTNKKMLLLILHIQILLIASQDFVPLVLGPDFQRAYDDKDILRGFKLNVQEGENPLKGHAFEGGVDSSPFSNSYTKSAVITSVDDLKEMMEIKGSLSVSYGPMISGSGAGSYLDKKVKSKRQVSILYRTRRVAYAKKVDVKTLQPVAGLDQLEPDEITERYGTKFIDQILYGAQLDVIFTVEATEDTDFFEIEAELKGKIGFGPLSVSFQANFQQQEGSSQSRYTMKIEAQASGIAFAVPSNPSFDQVNELIDEFNNKYEEMLNQVGEGQTVDVSNVANQFSPVAFALSPIAEYLPSKLSVEESARFDDKMEALRDVFFGALFIKSQVTKSRDEQELLYGNDPRVSRDIFQPYDDVVNSVKGGLNNKIDECLDYRKKSMREILETSSAVPIEYANTAVEVNVLNGLIGEAYIPSPVRIGGMTFEEFHYIGFALPGDGDETSSDSDLLVPWMGGMLRFDDDDSIVASAYSPEVLAEMGLAEISSGSGHKYLKYGDQIYLQSSSVDYRWLKRDNSTGNVMTKDYFAESSRSIAAGYKWHVRSMVGDPVLSDPKQGQCVKYGDMIFLNEDGWLHRKSPHECLVDNFADGSCVNTVDKDFQTSRLQWKIRSTFGSGTLEAGSNLDRAHGQCVQMLNKVYLQSNFEENWWLTGGRGYGQELALALDSYKTEGQIGAYPAKKNKCISAFPGVFTSSFTSTVARKNDACNSMFITDCQDHSPTQLMEYDERTLQIKHGDLCLDYYVDDGSSCANTVTLRSCDDSPARDQNCLLVTTGYVGSNDGPVDILVDSGSGYVTVSTPGKFYAHSEVVVDQCFEKIVGVKVKTSNDDAWTGSVELSTDGKVTYSPFTCSGCTGTTITMPIAVDGNGDSTDQATTRCHYGATCSLIHPSLILNNQQWRFDKNTMELKSVLDGKCLDIAGDDKLYMRECIGGANQKFEFIDEQSRHQSYEWIVSKEIGNGLRDDGFFCPADTAKGSWKPIQTVNGTYHEIGINRNIEFPYWKQTSSWDDSVVASVTSGFQFGNSGVKVPWIDAKEMETSVRDVLHDLDFMDDGDMKSGQAWQFVYEISDACEPMWELRTEDIVVTSDADQEPCCLPGQELNSNQPHGPCKYQSACQCGDSVCYPSGDAESAPTIAPTRTSIPPRNAPASTEDSNFAYKPTVYQAWIAIIVAAIVHYSGCY
eukprot:CAMPEP_0183702230 /NCGR_PEP_ID=MMETSP0737-20130205/397_1 /TAXON_ID=385413 /ORGANISM="Thalassiosira miniscula, Strain CCMP1093" /LENGTH=1178 /DNA_ID=CAMNT_0025928805 /DNA_START=113 /DNA_END=3649 /DNA_ORIENTATION=-